MNQIVDKKELASDIVQFRVKAPEIAAKARPGHFLIVRAKEKSERIPLTIADYDRDEGTVMIIVQEVGFSSREIANFKPGEAFQDLVGPLGQAVELDGWDQVVCVGGGLGAAPLYPKVKELRERADQVITILGAATAEKLILVEEFRDHSDQLYLATDDGSRGREGFVTDVLQEVITQNEGLDLVVAAGPMVMMKAVSGLTAGPGIKTLVSLNSIMVDGTGMCGGCRVTVGEETKFACVDGPVFDGHQVDFEEQIKRKQFYTDQEKKLDE